jgi:hypothetical protein
MGHLLEIKCADSRVNVHILASTIVTFTLTAMQVPNLALTHKKRITVQVPHLYHDDASAKFSTNLHITDYCVVHNCLQVGTSTEYVHCHITVATPLPMFGRRSRPLPSTLRNRRGKSAGFFLSLI